MPFREKRLAALKIANADSQAEVDVLMPLLDPELLPGPQGKLLIRGTELVGPQSNGHHKEFGTHIQLWLCTPLPMKLN